MLLVSICPFLLLVLFFSLSFFHFISSVFSASWQMEPANLQAFVTRASDSELYVHRSCICICIIDEHVAKLYVTATRVRIVKKKGCLRRLPDFCFFFFFFFRKSLSVSKWKILSMTIRMQMRRSKTSFIVFPIFVRYFIFQRCFKTRIPNEFMDSWCYRICIQFGCFI